MVMRPQDQSEPGPAGGEVDPDHDADVRAKVQRDWSRAGIGRR